MAVLHLRILIRCTLCAIITLTLPLTATAIHQWVRSIHDGFILVSISNFPTQQPTYEYYHDTRGAVILSYRSMQPGTQSRSSFINLG